jgi:hypothetical protein
MTTREVADKLITLCREGKHLEAVEELYADDIVSKEMPGYPGEITTGIKAVHKKSEDWLANVQEFHGSDISDPVVAGNHFTTKMSFDVTFKDRGRLQMDELCIYEVNNGKVVNEQFFYTM